MNTKVSRVSSRSQHRPAGGNELLGRFHFADQIYKNRSDIRSGTYGSKHNYIFAAFTPSFSIAESRNIGRSLSQPRNRMAPMAEMNRILWVLENKIEGRLLQEKAKDKLSTLRLSPEQIRLLDSLAARVIESDHTAAADIAFFLITALITLS